MIYNKTKGKHKTQRKIKEENTMTVRELLELFIDESSQEISVWDNEKEEVIWNGYLDEIPEDIEYEEVSSIDNLNTETEVLTVNIR